MSPKPVLWKPKYGSRVMRERAFARAELERERAARAASPDRGSLLSRVLGLFR